MCELTMIDSSQSQAPAKKAPARKKAPAASAAKQSQLSFTPAGRSSTRAAATKAKGKMVVSFGVF